ncbi:MAG TPA: flagellar basal body-associated protein FliL [Clostridiaceae bacterium]|nr:flagellar basal body-associated protein FliL [Clostridiaceae bacterium]
MGRGLKALIIILLVVIAGFLGFIVFKSGFLTNIQSQKSAPVEKIYSLGEYTVNLNEPDYRRYIKVKISVGYNEKKLDAEIAEKASPINDVINSVLRTKKLADVDTAKKTEAVKAEMKDKINAILDTGKLTNVYFDEILVQ